MSAPGPRQLPKPCGADKDYKINKLSHFCPPLGTLSPAMVTVGNQNVLYDGYVVGREIAGYRV